MIRILKLSMAENTIDFQPYLPRATYKVFRKTCGPPPLKPHVSLEDYEDFARTSLSRRHEGLVRIVLQRDEVDN